MEQLKLIKGSQQPAPRGGASFIEYDKGKFVLIGGANRNEELNDFWMLCVSYAQNQPLNAIWSKLELENQGLYTPRSGQATFIDEQKHIYIFGGQKFETGQQTDEFFRIDVESKSIKIVQCTNKPKARNSHTLTYAQGRAYLFGGANEDGPLADFHIFDIDKAQWEPETLFGAQVHPREMHTSHVLTTQSFNSLFVVQDGTPIVQTQEHKVIELDFQFANEQIEGKLATVNIGQEAVNIEEQKEQPNVTENVQTASCTYLIVIGGRCGADLLDEILLINLSNYQCARINKFLPHPICAHASVINSSNIAIFGGLTNTGFSGDVLLISAEDAKCHTSQQKPSDMAKIAISGVYFTERQGVLLFGGSSIENESNALYFMALNSILNI